MFAATTKNKTTKTLVALYGARLYLFSVGNTLLAVFTNLTLEALHDTPCLEPHASICAKKCAQATHTHT
jgi:hypothetical protein